MELEANVLIAPDGPEEKTPRLITFLASVWSQAARILFLLWNFHPQNRMVPLWSMWTQALQITLNPSFLVFLQDVRVC